MFLFQVSVCISICFFVFQELIISVAKLIGQPVCIWKGLWLRGGETSFAPNYDVSILLDYPRKGAACNYYWLLTAKYASKITKIALCTGWPLICGKELSRYSNHANNRSCFTNCIVQWWFFLCDFNFLKKEIQNRAICSLNVHRWASTTRLQLRRTLTFGII